jgi:hypothetical protein
MSLGDLAEEIQTPDELDRSADMRRAFHDSLKLRCGVRVLTCCQVRGAERKPHRDASLRLIGRKHGLRLHHVARTAGYLFTRAEQKHCRPAMHTCGWT